MNANDGTGAAEGGPPTKTVSPTCRGGNRGAEKPALSHDRPEAEPAGSRGCWVLGETQGSPILFGPCVTLDFSQTQSLLDEVEP